MAKIIKFLKKTEGPVAIVDPITMKVTSSEGVEKESGDRLQKIRNHIDKINRLMAELKSYGGRIEV